MLKKEITCWKATDQVKIQIWGFKNNRYEEIQSSHKKNLKLKVMKDIWLTLVVDFCEETVVRELLSNSIKLDAEVWDIALWVKQSLTKLISSLS